MSVETANPWYREPWPWFIIGIVGLGVVSGLGILTMGIKNAPEIVSGDYRQLGKALVDTDERTGKARALGLSGELDVRADSIELTLIANDQDTLPDTLLVRFRHPAFSEHDSTTLVRRANNGHYRGELITQPHEKAHVVVSDISNTWWLGGRRNDQPGETVALIARRL